MAARKNETRGVVHNTLVIERTFAAPPAAVFDAWRDVKAREIWSAPTPETVIVYDQAEFREQGLDMVRCGAVGDLRFLAEVRYLDIVENERIIFAERVSEAGVRASVALITMTLHAEDAATRMHFTAQLAALDGSDMVEGYRYGWGAAFDNLEAYFKRATA